MLKVFQSAMKNNYDNLLNQHCYQLNTAIDEFIHSYSKKTVLSSFGILAGNEELL